MNHKYTALLLCMILVLGGCASTNAPALDTTVAHASAAKAAPVKPYGNSGSASTDGKGTKISEFSTEFKNAVKSRSHNITMAAKAIDETIIQPGEIFSFNETVGPTTKANGFKLGRIFIKGQDSKGYGGGVCQVSSTLFNAAEKAGLEIIERHQHSKHVDYVEDGRDATTSYGGADFKFMNNKTNSIRINSYIGEEKVTVVILEL